MQDSIAKRAARDRIADHLVSLPGQVARALLLDDRILQLAHQLKDEQSLLFFGRGYNYATALEAALKVRILTPVIFHPSNIGCPLSRPRS